MSEKKPRKPYAPRKETEEAREKEHEMKVGHTRDIVFGDCEDVTLWGAL